MLILVLIVVLCLPSAAMLWIARGRSRAAAEAVRLAQCHATAEVGYLRACIEASRDSCELVLRRLETALRDIAPELDAFVAFTPDGEVLRAAYTSGERADHFLRAAVARDNALELPALAALAGHRIELGSGARAFLPTDRSAVAVPLLDVQGLRVVLYLSSSRANAFVEMERIVRVAGNAASAYALACEREEDRAAATYDGLTGLLTPRAFRDRLHGELAPAHGCAERTASLWFIDTDHFKRVNDEYGHAAGDVVLQGMASLLRAHTFVDLDIAGRNGGDEFCALIRESQKTVAIERAHALCTAIREADFGVPLPVTASIGVATFPYDAASSNALLEAADAAMYHSKRHGRDRVSYALDSGTFAIFR